VRTLFLELKDNRNLYVGRQLQRARVPVPADLRGLQMSGALNEESYIKKSRNGDYESEEKIK
jgi:hypothetical protein